MLQLPVIHATASIDPCPSSPRSMGPCCRLAERPGQGRIKVWVLGAAIQVSTSAQGSTPVDWTQEDIGGGI